MQKLVIATASTLGFALCGVVGWWASQPTLTPLTGEITVQRAPIQPMSVVSVPPRVPQPVKTRTDPLAQEPDQLFMNVRAERRDERWSEQAETALSYALGRIPEVGHGRPLAISCASSICEVSGVAANNDDYDAVQRTWEKLRAATRHADLAQVGLVPSGSTLGTARDVAGFVIYFRREAP